MLHHKNQDRAATKGMRFKKSLLAMSVMALSAPSFSQVANEGEGLEEIVVLGMKTSLENAQDIKREAATVKDVITASDIGALPDKSVTEALQRVPGVTIERFASSTDPNHFAAEGRGVIVRGLDKVRSEFNGRDSFSANTSGGLNFEDIPPELLGSVEVVKNQTADLIAGGISGTVNLITRKPFDSNERIVSFTAKGSYGDMVDDIAPAFSGLFSDSWETGAGEFGFLISVSESEFTAHGDGVAVENFYERSATQTEFPAYGSTEFVWIDPADSTNRMTYRPGETLYMPHGAQINTSDSERDRTGVATSLQWRNPSETVLATAEFIRSDSSETWRERVVFPGIQGFNANVNGAKLLDLDTATPGIQSDAVFDSNGYFVSGSMTFDDPFIASSRSHQVDNVIEDLSFHLTLTPTDNLKIDLDAQRVDTTADVVNNTISNAFRNSHMYLDVSGDIPKVQFLQDTTALDPAAPDRYYQASIMDTEIAAKGDLESFSADVEYTIDQGWFKSASAGLYYSEREQTIRDDDYANWGGVSATWAATGLQSALIDRPELYEAHTFGGDFFDGEGLMGDNRTFLFPRLENTFDVVAYDEYLVGKGISNIDRVNRRNRDFNGDGIPDTDADGYLPYEKTITGEERQEAYLRVDFANEGLSMPVKANIGMRYVRYEVEATGSSRFLEVVPETNENFYPFYAATYPELAAFFDNTGSLAETNSAEPYSTVLPSLNLSVGITDDFIMRFAASKALYFPQMRELRNTGTYRGSFTEQWLYDDLSKTTASWACDTWSEPGVTRCNEPVGVTGVGIAGFRGNPDLEPEKATQFDLTGEWYFAAVGSLTLSLFYKEIEDLIREQNFQETIVNPNSGLELEMSVRRPVNEGEGEVKGFEIAYQQFYDFLPGAWSGLGLQLNYTYIDQKDLNDERGDLGAPNDLSAYGDTRNSFRNFTGLSLPGLSEETFNIVGMYEYNDISARIAYNWRSEYLLARRDANSFSAIYADATGFMDASIWYAINENFKVGIEAANLTGEVVSTTTQLNQAGVKTEKSNFLTDTRYAISLRATF